MNLAEGKNLLVRFFFSLGNTYEIFCGETIVGIDRCAELLYYHVIYHQIYLLGNTCSSMEDQSIGYWVGWKDL